VASLRQLGIPLAQISVILGLAPEAAAQQVRGYWIAAEAEHAGRRELDDFLVYYGEVNQDSVLTAAAEGSGSPGDGCPQTGMCGGSARIRAGP
jgi:hypothetical protein